METTKNLDFFATLFPLVIIIFIIAVGVVLLTQQFRKNLYLQKLKQEELKNQHQLELLRSSIEVQEEERKRIARDMHDELGATLAIARMHLLQAERLVGDGDSKLLAHLQNIRSLTETSLNNMRQISHQLMPPQLETFGLLKTLDYVSAQLNKAGSVQLKVQAPDQWPELGWPISLALYRVFMELINNTIRHAGASHIDILLADSGRLITATYRDNGKGLPAGNTLAGIGQKSIEGRVNALGGTVTMGNHPDGGFQASIRVPLGA